MLPSTAWAKVLDQVRPDGTVSEQTALQAFALAYGALPGVHLPSGPVGQIPDGTLAAYWALSSCRSRLKPREQRLVDRLLGLPPPGASAHVAGAPHYGDAGFTPNPTVTALAETWADSYDAKFGITLPLEIITGYTTTVVTPKPGHVALADAQPLDDADGGYGKGVPAICRIRVPPAGQIIERTDPVSFGLIMAHEAFHCFEFYLLGARAWHNQPAAWVMEGLADWAARVVDPVSYSVGGGSFNAYLNSPQTPLFERTYDAVGFWGHVEDTFDDLWSLIPAILNANGNTGAFGVADGADPVAFLNTWGASEFNLPRPGWDMLSPIIPPGSAPINIIDATGRFEAAQYTTAEYAYFDTDPKTPLVAFLFAGSVRVSTRYNYTDDGWFCTIRRCVCPRGTIGSVPPTRPLSTSDAVGITGNPSTGTAGSVAAYPLSYFCHPKPPSGTGGRSGTGTAGSFGDPHFMYFTGGDGGFFDFQAAGEFTLLKSTQDDFQIQVRQQPWAGRRLPELHSVVSVTTAVAIRAGPTTVEIDLGAKVEKAKGHSRCTSTRSASVSATSTPAASGCRSSATVTRSPGRARPSRFTTWASPTR